VISTQKGFLFVHIPKSAGNSIQTVLAPFADDQILRVRSQRDDLEHLYVSNGSLGTRKHSTLADYRRALDPELYRSLFKFTCVRNPWDRMVSHFFFKQEKRGREDFDAVAFRRFVSKRRPAAHYLVADSRWRCLKRRPLWQRAAAAFDEIDFFLRFENLNGDFRALCDRLRIPFEPLPLHNRSRHDHYSRYYDEASYRTVRDRFRDEIDYFGFRFETG